MHLGFNSLWDNGKANSATFKTTITSSPFVVVVVVASLAKPLSPEADSSIEVEEAAPGGGGGAMRAKGPASPKARVCSPTRCSSLHGKGMLRRVDMVVSIGVWGEERPKEVERGRGARAFALSSRVSEPLYYVNGSMLGRHQVG
ncbi:BZ3500_MvSof-1268-A1-R1_Chr2-1g04192 [Microbotryum saponariae]|uniref:BZ3500_MvSof-1268-A1-R1_Chr2-1g04192 protein n=1 Tax=Microbotryum saponariae TaxID=289078 RepID=A0A2X0KDZ1_9BASI|nr:BZ3500_MvSof-1268-A1-R1_Chr2-1g04192 [Microbotryum saponariae]SCZ91179.1 BZ3501_MvSof-1269-A2-R1_Chr2-1g03848 [Microbotryum saponariae]